MNDTIDIIGSGLSGPLLATILAKKHNYNIYIPKFEFCTDNAAMIAIAGYYKYLNHSSHLEY